MLEILQVVSTGIVRLAAWRWKRLFAVTAGLGRLRMACLAVGRLESGKTTGAREDGVAAARRHPLGTRTLIADSPPAVAALGLMGLGRPMPPGGRACGACSVLRVEAMPGTRVVGADAKDSGRVSLASRRGILADASSAEHLVEVGQFATSLLGRFRLLCSWANEAPYSSTAARGASVAAGPAPHRVTEYLAGPSLRQSSVGAYAMRDAFPESLAMAIRRWATLGWRAHTGTSPDACSHSQATKTHCLVATLRLRPSLDTLTSWSGEGWMVGPQQGSHCRHPGRRCGHRVVAPAMVCGLGCTAWPKTRSCDGHDLKGILSCIAPAGPSLRPQCHRFRLDAVALPSPKLEHPCFVRVSDWSNSPGDRFSDGPAELPLDLFPGRTPCPHTHSQQRPRLPRRSSCQRGLRWSRIAVP